MRRFLLGSFLVVALPASAGSPLSLQVTPRVSFEPTRLKVIVRIEANADNRALRIEADSGSFYRSSDVSLEGDAAAPLQVVWFDRLPAGQYRLTAQLRGTRGVRAFASAKVNVIPTH